MNRLADGHPASVTEISRRRLMAGLAPLALGGLLGGAQAAPGRVVLPPAHSLSRELAAALRVGRPLVVLVSLDGCAFCHVVRDSYLGPLRSEEKQPVVQIDMQSSRALTDFAGAATTHGQLVRAWSVKVAPTVLFFGAGGREVAQRLAGASIPDFYGAYLDDRLRTARKSLG